MLHSRGATRMGYVRRRGTYAGVLAVDRRLARATESAGPRRGPRRNADRCQRAGEVAAGASRSGHRARRAGAFGRLTRHRRGRLRLFDAVTRFLQRLASQQATAVVLDDLQWADESSLQLLKFVARPYRPVPLVIIGAYRHDEHYRYRPVTGRPGRPWRVTSFTGAGSTGPARPGRGCLRSHYGGPLGRRDPPAHRRPPVLRPATCCSTTPSSHRGWCRQRCATYWSGGCNG